MRPRSQPTRRPARPALCVAALAALSAWAWPATGQVTADARQREAEQRATWGGDAGVGQLRQALADPGDADARLVAARAAAALPRLPEALIDPLFAALSADGPAELADAATAALVGAADRPTVVARLADVAADTARPRAARRAAVRALGEMPTKRSAAALAKLLGDDQVDAAAALARLAALPDGADSAAWWGDVSGQDETTFAANVAAARAARHARAERQNDALAEAYGRLVGEEYRRADADGKMRLLRQHLAGAVPAVRAMAADWAWRDMSQTGTLPPDAAPLLRDRLADVDAAVRARVARALAAVNDPGSLDALLAQIGREPVAEVKVELARALAPTRDPRAAGALLAVLDDGPPAAAAAAQALATLAPAVAGTPVGDAAANRLEQLVRDGATPTPLAEAAVEARVGLGGDVVPLLIRVAADRPEPATPVLRAALRGLAEVGDDRADGVVAELTSHPEPRVRQAAVRATPRTSLGINRADLLKRRMDARYEPDAAVRQEAWQALLALLPRGPEQQLAAWPERFADDPPRRLAVLRLLAEKARDRGDTDGLAHRLQQIGELLEAEGRPDEAAEALARSLELTRLDEAAPAMVLLARSRLLTDALLTSRQYGRAAALGASLIEQYPEYRGDVGTWLRLEADRLVEAGDLDAADELVEAALAMEPRLADSSRRQLRDTAGRIEERRRAGGGRPARRAVADVR